MPQLRRASPHQGRPVLDEWRSEAAHLGRRAGVQPMIATVRTLPPAHQIAPLRQRLHSLYDGMVQRSKKPPPSLRHLAATVAASLIANAYRLDPVRTLKAWALERQIVQRGTVIDMTSMLINTSWSPRSPRLWMIGARAILTAYVDALPQGRASQVSFLNGASRTQAVRLSRVNRSCMTRARSAAGAKAWRTSK